MAVFTTNTTNAVSIEWLWQGFGTLDQFGTFGTGDSTSFRPVRGVNDYVNFVGTNFTYSIFIDPAPTIFRTPSGGTYTRINLETGSPGSPTILASLTDFGGQPLLGQNQPGRSAIVLAGNDTISGNAGADTLTAYDSISGGGGNDTIDGGSGGDTIDGGSGIDTASYASATSQVVVYLSAPSLNYGDAAGDTYTSIEVIAGSNFNDYLYGSNSAVTGDQLYGGAGIDTIFGYAGDDTLSGGADYDYIVGGDGNDRIFGDAGQDIITGDNGNDTIDGGSADDQIYGAAGNDTLNGDDGNDLLYGGADDDQVFGGIGTDFLFGESGNDSMFGGEGYDLLQGGDGNDTLGGGASNFTGDVGLVNSLFGQGGNDVLRGTQGIDYMRGGDGFVDTGNDSFEIGANGSVDLILDFQAGAAVGDTLHFFGSSYASFAALQAAGRFVQVGTYAGVFYDASNGNNVVYLENVNIAQFAANDFLFN
jgi:Ca2+-binding RTX toxin-like protein